MIKLAIFDLDGTTVNSLKSIAYYANETLKAFGLSPFPTDEYRRLAGGGADKLMRNLIAASGASEELLIPMREDWLKRYNEDFMYLTEPYEGVGDMLLSLKGMGVRTAIVTNKHRSIAEKICRTLFGDDGRLLDECVSDHPGMALKPAPDELLSLMERYGATREECLYCGDHTLDMQTGRNAGVTAIGVTWGFHSAEALKVAGADFLANTPTDIVHLVQRINSERI